MAGLSGLSALSGCNPIFGGLRPFEFDLGLAVFTPWMAQRALAGPFDYGFIHQGRLDGVGVVDGITFPRGDLLGNAQGRWYENFDPYQGTFNMWLVPEWDGDDGLNHTISLHCADGASIFYLQKSDTNFLRAYVGGGFSTGPSTAAWTAGTLYHVVFRWDSKKTLDGTNHGCWTVDTVDTFDRTAYVADEVPLAAMRIGSGAGLDLSLDSGVVGFTIYRRVLYDGTVGVDVGNGDELAQIYAGGAGLDSCLVTGAFDIVFALPTNQDGTVLQNTLQAWSMCHDLSLPDVSFMSDGGYLCEPWCVEFTGNSTYINCGSGVTLDDIPNAGVITAGVWVRLDPSSIGYRIVMMKGSQAAARGWELGVTSAGVVQFLVYLAGGNAQAISVRTVQDAKWHYITGYYIDATKTARAAVDGSWGAADVGAGAYQVDAADPLYIGRRVDAASQWWDGGIGWIAIWNDDHHVAGTDFVQPRVAPAPGGALVESWHHDEGTGVTTTAQVIVPGNNGTIVVGTWSAPWEFEGTPVIPKCVEYNGTTTTGVITDAVRIQDLHAGVICAEAWICADGWGEVNFGRVWDKTASGASGWNLYVNIAQGLGCVVYCAGTDATSWSVTDEFLADGIFHHVAFQFDGTALPAGNPLIYLWIDGIPVTSYGSQVAGVGAANTDVGNDLYLGSRSDGNATFDGRFAGWARVSSVARYTNGEAFIPAGLLNPPGVDVNTAWQTDFPDGAGATLTDASAGANNCTLTNYFWWNTPDMESIEPGARVFGWGYNLGSDGANDGMTVIEDAQVTAETDYVIRTTISPGNSGRAQPQLRIWDNIGAAQIGADYPLPAYVGQHTGANASAVLIAAGGYFTQQIIGWVVYNITDTSLGTITAVSGDKTTVTAPLGGGVGNLWDTNDWYYIRPPNNQSYCQHPHSTESIFVFRTPAACTSIDVKILNAAGEGVLGIHQCEVYESPLPNGDIEAALVGVPPIPPGWTNAGLDAGDTQAEAVIIHAGAQSWRWNVGAIAGEIARTAIAAIGVGTYYMQACWSYGDATASMFFGDQSAVRSAYQYAQVQQYELLPNDICWTHSAHVRRAILADVRPAIQAGTGAAAGRYIDDVYAVLLNAVNLTVTPANYANSLVGTMLMVNGLDACVQPIPVNEIQASKGTINFRYAARHADADIADFGYAQPRIFYAASAGADYIDLFWQAAGTIRLEMSVGAVVSNADWVTGGFFVPDAIHDMQVRWLADRMQLYVDGVLRTTIWAPVAFVAVPNQANWLHDAAGLTQVDGMVG